MSKLNGSVDRLAEALRDVVVEAVDERVEERLAPIQRELAQHGVLLRAIARNILPEDALADVRDEEART